MIWPTNVHQSLDPATPRADSCVPCRRPRRVARAARAAILLTLALLPDAFGWDLGRCRQALAAEVPTRLPIAAGTVRVGRRDVVSLRGGDGILDADGRAGWANRTIADALHDPKCGPEGWGFAPDGDAFVITLCARRVLSVTAADASVAGSTTAELAKAWTDSLRQAYGEEKPLLFSAQLLRRAVIAILYPLGFLALAWMLRILDRRLTHRLLIRVRRHKGLSIGPVRLFTTGGERALLGGVLTVIRVVVAVVLVYALVVGLLRQFPGTAEWAARLWQPLRGLASDLGAQTLSLVPRIVLALLVLGALRLALRATRQLFAQVRAGRLQVEPVLSRENATELEVVVRVAILAVGLFLLALLVPGQGGVVLLAVGGLFMAAFVLGARDLTADLLGGLAGVFLRTFRTGQRIRCGGVEGLVRARGLLYTQLEAEDGGLLLLPNQRLLQQPVEVIGRERALSLQVTLEGQAAAETAPGLFQLAAATCGLKRQDGRVQLVGVKGGAMVFQVEWPLSAPEAAEELRSQYLRALLAKAPALHLVVAAAEPVPHP